MKKQLPTARIASELSESSVFFPKRTPPDDIPPSPPTPTHARRAVQGNGESEAGFAERRTIQRTVEAPFDQRHERSVERTKVRHTFDIFHDQLSALRKIQLEREESVGKRDLLGELVQEALDLFITKQRTGDGSFNRSFERTKP